MTEEKNQQDPFADQPDANESPEDRSSGALDDLGDPGTQRAASIDALAAMAAGQDAAPPAPVADDLPTDSDQPVQPDPTGQVPPDAPAFELEGLAATASANADGRTDAFAAAGPPAGDAASRQQALQARRKRAASLVGQSQRAHAQQFKSFMIPMLVVTGSLLFILATIVALLMPDAAEGFSSDSWYEDTSTKKVLVLVAYPLGAILFFGAFLFYKDLQRHKNQKQ
jgi:hypothetical protein